MQCSACRAVFSNGLDTCPRCQSILPPAKTAATAHSPAENKTPNTELQANSPALSIDAPLMTSETANAKSSTLLEFPGVNRTPLPQWRKDLSERVREIQERRAREAAREAEEAAYRRASQVAVQQDEEMAVAAAASQSLGLLPSPEAPPMNPIVAAALRRVERARRSAPPPVPRARASSGGAAAAIAHFAEEQFHQDLLPAVLPENVPPPTPPLVPAKEPTVAETALQMQRAHNLVVVAPKHAAAAPESAGLPEPPKQLPAPPKETEKAPVKGTEKKAPPAVTVNASATSATVVETSVAAAASVDAAARTPRKVFAGVVDDAMLARRESESSSVSAAPVQENYDDRAPLAARLVANAIDLVLIAFASSPFGAIIELTNGNWSDPRVIGAMAGIFCVVAFLYSTISTLLAGRTFGMSLVSLRAVDAETSLQPSTKQAMGRALVYLVSLALGGLGIIYALFDAEGRTLHDHLSGTVVIRD